MSPLALDEAFAYLLGELDEAKSTAIEDAAFADEGVFEELLAFEGELIDAYVQGELEASRRARFEARWLATAEQRARVESARALRDRARRSDAPAPPFWGRLFARPPVRWALATALASTVAIVAWRFEVRPGPGVFVSLRPQVLRAQAATPILHIDPDGGRVEIELSLEDELPRAGWEVVIKGPAGEIWRGPPAAADAIAVRVEVPARRWGAGRHLVLLVAEGATVLEYELRVEPNR